MNHRVKIKGWVCNCSTCKSERAYREAVIRAIAEQVDRKIMALLKTKGKKKTTRRVPGENKRSVHLDIVEVLKAIKEGLQPCIGDRCPICSGSGKISPPLNDYKTTGAPFETVCHVCCGAGIVWKDK